MRPRMTLSSGDRLAKEPEPSPKAEPKESLSLSLGLSLGLSLARSCSTGSHYEFVFRLGSCTCSCGVARVPRYARVLPFYRPLTRSAPFDLQIACCGVSPARGTAAGTPQAPGD